MLHFHSLPFITDVSVDSQLDPIFFRKFSANLSKNPKVSK